MSFNASLFKNDRKQTDKQPDYTGPCSISKENFMKLADAITAGKCQFDNRGEIKLKVAGWRRESNNGRPYISLAMSLDDYVKPAEAPAGDDEPLF